MTNIVEKIKKLLAALLSVFAMLFSFGSVQPDMDIRVENTPTQTIYVEWTNTTGTVMHTPQYHLEKETNGNWERIAFADDFGFNDIASVHYPLQGGSFTVVCETVFGEELSPGNYRFCMDYRTTENQTAVCEFVIPQAPEA